jgi:hypothetical protein
MAQARCPYCGRWYAVHPRLWGRQKTCGRAECRAKHKAALNRKWWKEHPEKRQERYEQVKARRRKQKYWDKRRARLPDYVKRNREETRERMRLLRAKRREAAQILKAPLQYLERLGAPEKEMFATQESIGSAARRVKQPRPTMFATQEPIAAISVGVWKYLKARALFATQEGFATRSAVRV